MKVSVPLTLVALAASTTAQQAQPWGQCGGNFWAGPTQCVAGWTCVAQNVEYSQCLQAATTISTRTTTASRTTTTKTTKTSKTTTTKTSKTSSVKTTTTSKRPTTISVSPTPTPSTTTPSTTTPSGPTGTPPTGTYPLEGFARDNPIGPVSGGAGGPTTTVSSYAAFTSAAKGTTPKVIYVSGIIALTSSVKILSNTSVIGVGNNSGFTGKTITIRDADNVIVRNLKISFVTGSDLMVIDASTRVWIDHNELFNTISVSQGPDYYDGQIDITHATDYVTISWNYLHDHWKSSLVGNSDSNRGEDFGHLKITYHHNYWKNCGTRGPAGRFGHQHIYNNLYEDFLYQAIHSRSDNQVLVEGNVFRGNTREALSTYGLVIPEDSPNTCTCGDYELDGFANLGAANDWGTAGVNITRVGTFYSAGYAYNLTPLSSVEAVVKAGAGVGKI